MFFAIWVYSKMLLGLKTLTFLTASRFEFNICREKFTR